MERLQLWILLGIAASIIAPTATTAEVRAEQIELPRIERKSMLNGLQVVFFDGKYERMPFILMIENGAAFDPADKWGVTYLMSRMFLEQLADRNYLPEFENRGIEVECRVGWDAIHFVGSAPEDQLEFALLTLAEAIVRPEFSESSFTRLRAELLEDLQSDQQNLERSTERIFLEAVFQNNPYGHPVKGTSETVEKIYFRDVIIQQRRLMMPNQARLGLYFTGDRETFFRRLSRRWGSWIQDDPAPFTFRQSRAPDTPRVKVLENEREEGILRWGRLAVERSSRDYFAFKVLEQYLLLALPDWGHEIGAQGQIKGYVALAARKMPGYFQISIETPSALLPGYSAKIQREMEGLRSGQVESHRFAEAKQLVLQEFQTRMKDPFERIMEVFATELYQIGINYIATFGLRLERVTEERFSDTVERHFPGNEFVLVLAGRPPEILPFAEDLGDVELLN